MSTLSLAAVLASYMAAASSRPITQVSLLLLGDCVNFESVAICLPYVRICHHAMHGSSVLRQDFFKRLRWQNLCCDAYRSKAEQWSRFCKCSNTQQTSDVYHIYQIWYLLTEAGSLEEPSYEGAFEARLTIVCYITSRLFASCLLNRPAFETVILVLPMHRRRWPVRLDTVHDIAM